MNLIELSQTIDSKVRLLTQKLERLQAENTELKHEIAHLKEKLNKQIEIVNQSEDKVKGLVIGENPERQDWVVDVKRQLDDYISELDRCIAWLENE
jgi:chromosome segregation ATPase